MAQKVHDLTTPAYASCARFAPSHEALDAEQAQNQAHERLLLAQSLRRELAPPLERLPEHHLAATGTGW